MTFSKLTQVAQASAEISEITDGVSAAELPLEETVERIVSNETLGKFEKYEALAAYGALTAPSLSESALSTYWIELVMAFDAEESSFDDQASLGRSIVIARMLAVSPHEVS